MGKWLFYFTPEVVQIRRIFFLSATLHMQKKIKEIAYILTSFQALLKAELFFYHFYSQSKTTKWKYNFSLFFYWYNSYIISESVYNSW